MINKKQIAISVAAAVLALIAVLTMYRIRYQDAGRQDAVQNSVKQDMYEQNSASALKAIAKNPNDVNARMGLAYRYISQHDLTRAVAQLTEVQKVQPENRKVTYTLGLALEEGGNTQEALSVWKKLEQRNDAWGQAARRHLNNNAAHRVH